MFRHQYAIPHISALFIIILSLVTSIFASSPASFCKCTCFTNSTIIPLDPTKSKATSLVSAFHLLSRGDSEYRPLGCNDCNRKFCLDYDLPTCKGAKEDDVFTTCFQRDSRKDEAIVFMFIFATGGLLAWAVCKPWVEKYIEAARERRSYMPISENANR
ncbi:hypothetical protein BDV25DRAFT_162616 [Aspergillus avenaceus]|uniref:Uncharacterized protein n=1 Tax=Aspergillus avenaceus TaxID=36643 RepID=A0A5N6TJD2_ASPAV|nr:hypothetical protein BDV25DRAFT_162616 [Aspergillus avenaceus]